MKTLAEYLAMTHEDPYQFFTACYREINRAAPSTAEVDRDFNRWQRNQANVPYYVKRHFEREHERAQGLPGGQKLPDIYHVGHQR